METVTKSGWGGDRAGTVSVPGPIVCFANDWNGDPTSKHHVMRCLARETDVLWVESAGMRVPNLASAGDLGRIVRRLRSAGAPPRLEAGVRVVSPLSLPLPGNPVATALNARLYRRAVRRANRGRESAGAPLLWVYTPTVAPYLGAFTRRGLVYHCVDRWWAFEEYDPRVMRACHERLCREADVVIASAQELLDDCRAFTDRAYLVRHGVEWEHFAAAALEQHDVPPDLADAEGHPVIGFFGLIHDWIDQDLLGHVADAFPESELVMIGKTRVDVSGLSARPNVRFLGQKPYAALPAYAARFDVALVPFVLNELTRAVNPIKLREYLSAGLPVVSTALPEIIALPDDPFIRVASTSDEFVQEAWAVAAGAADAGGTASGGAASPLGIVGRTLRRDRATRQGARGLRRLTPKQAAAAVAHRTRRRIGEVVETFGGLGRMEGRAQAWARRWSAAWGEKGMGAWLRRPGAGRLWVDVEDAPAWCRSSDSQEDRTIADAAVVGHFDLIGSGRVELGVVPDWRRDLYSGVEWPLRRSAGYGIVRGDGSDVRTVWELSRFYHALPLARAAWGTTGQAPYVATFDRHVRSFAKQNPPGYGPHWASPMDVALRCCNWAAAAVLLADHDAVDPSLWPFLLAELYVAGQWLERHLEWHPVYRGNHFVADAVGLVYVGALFRDDRFGERWLRTGARILSAEIFRQVHDDGGSFEAALGYHRLALELFACGGEVVRRTAPSLLADGYMERLDGMLRFLAAYLPASGEAPMVGDADDGRVHLFRAAAARHPRRHALGLPPWLELPDVGGSEAFPDAGFFVLRRGTDHAVIRCGPVGLAGAGSHDHDDQLSLELVLGGRRVLADSGTYCYTRDLDARHAFRSTAAHNVVQIDGEESNPIDRARPWRILGDWTRSRLLRWGGEASADFTGAHHGYAHRASGVVFVRSVQGLRPGVWRIEDRLDGGGRETIASRLHLAPGLAAEPVGDDAFVVALDGGRLRIRWTVPPPLRLSVEAVQGSDAYGSLDDRTAIVAHGTIDLPVNLEVTLEMEHE